MFDKLKIPLVLAGLVFAFGLGSALAEDERPVVILRVQGMLDPALARYVLRGLEQARELQASAVVIQLDTPGGLDRSRRRIVQGILNSPVPVIVYVSPRGARASSAGELVTRAAHVSAMAPGTHLGAVRSAEEAKKKGIVDFTASNLEDLLRQAQGFPVRTVFGVSGLSVQGQAHPLVRISAAEWFFHRLAHPGLAYILLLLGIYALLYELATPGTIFAGFLGTAFLILALAALEVLDVNWAGMAMIVLSLVLFLTDIKKSGHGGLTVAGLAAFVLGSLLLFPGARIPGLRLPPTSIAAGAVVTGAFFLGLRTLKKRESRSS